MKITKSLLLVPALLAASLVACSGEEEVVQDPQGENAENTENVETPKALPAGFLGNQACPMSGNQVKTDAFYEHNGEKIYFCCNDCAENGAKDPDKWRNQVYAETKPVGNTDCPLQPGEAVNPDSGTVQWQGHEIGVCCSFCVNNFASDPERFARIAMGLPVDEEGE